ncbi:hypothetical protein BKA66DRAFT_472452 [Pyrenochaeta sp. MPI-SDFR-AT-0127]|nr:hypothetical protein BKA66DRAFT_472452 [Pyrenochaeta sp. MPI-SDFR-AT-0127]
MPRMESFLESLQLLPELRILHLRQPNLIEPPERTHDNRRMNDLEVESQTFKIQRFANAFFSYLSTRKWCPKISALVLCSSQHAIGFGQLSRVQHCYVKGFQTDTMGRCAVVGVPVTRMQLRCTEPWADILDFDPEMSWYNPLPTHFNNL